MWMLRNDSGERIVYEERIGSVGGSQGVQDIDMTTTDFDPEAAL
jgi:hypothetical protein